MPDVTQSFSQLLLTYGPGAMLDLPDNAVVVSGLQGWCYAGNWQYVAEDRLVPLLRAQLGDKLGADFVGLRQPPVQDEERRDDRAPGVEVRLAPGVSLTAQGKLYALGQPDRPVRIVGTGSRWEGIFGSAGSDIVLEHTEIQGGGAGGTVIGVENGALAMRGVRVNDNGGQIRVDAGRLEVRDSEIAGNDMPYGAPLEASYRSGGTAIAPAVRDRVY